ncbi:hypothetical protein AAFF_G00005680 [Aldrovandia affinis]|uniref:BZIP domain-containing protein n=1 Tax=Aldrovandia affinis TaxID=143900 RepID=A0AAD7X5D8_9TELE|nr:hypothetical protein AAFF_G00005680 [Aldrovandia affinis]
MEPAFSLPLLGETSLVPLGGGLTPKGLRTSCQLRRQREFMPDEKKDASYWEKRRKNNEAAKRSREKRRVSDSVLEVRLAVLSEENMHLHAELLALRLRLGLLGPRACHQPGLLPLALPGPLPNCPPSQLDRHHYWGSRASALPPYHNPFPQSTHIGASFAPAHSPAGRRYPYLFDKYAPAHMPLLLCPLQPPPSTPVPWAGLPPPRPTLVPRTSSDEEDGEQQVPAALEADPRTALPHKLRLKARGPQGWPELDGPRKKPEAVSSPLAKRLCVSD